jgi:hypothetical protein
MNARKKMKILVPPSFEAEEVVAPVYRHPKKSTLVACIAAGGWSRKLLLVVDRVTMEGEFLRWRYGKANACVVHQIKSFMSNAIWDYWAKELFFPAVEQKRRQLNYKSDCVSCQMASRVIMPKTFFARASIKEFESGS